jgi:hypothetical protein
MMGRELVSHVFGHVTTQLVIARFFGRNDRADFAVVAGILRLSTKYIVDGLRMKALEHIAVAWPSTLKSWDAREDHAHSILELDATSHGGLAYPSPIVSPDPSRRATHCN